MKMKEVIPSILNSCSLLKMKRKDLMRHDRRTVPVIISLTSISSRLGSVSLVIRSLLSQRLQPEKIILWLNEDLRSRIPIGLEDLLFERFSIQYTSLQCSHKKLVHTLALYPDRVIITCDDDVLYHEQWLEALYLDHLINPKGVIAHQVRLIRRDSDGNLKAYKEWNSSPDVGSESDAWLAIGGKGVLYPIDPFDERYSDSELFLKLTPTADDLWFKAMEILKGTSVRKCLFAVPDPIPIIGTQKMALKTANIDQDKNRIQWSALENHFDITL
ncbi:hypothetical protein OAC75_02565 [Pseudomonadales bacterium]|nr:hypothetical protein [Pseudomonadales bacterium]